MLVRHVHCRSELHLRRVHASAHHFTPFFEPSTTSLKHHTYCLRTSGIAGMRKLAMAQPHHPKNSVQRRFSRCQVSPTAKPYLQNAQNRTHQQRKALHEKSCSAAKPRFLIRPRRHPRYGLRCRHRSLAVWQWLHRRSATDRGCLPRGGAGLQLWQHVDWLS